MLNPINFLLHIFQHPQHKKAIQRCDSLSLKKCGSFLGSDKSLLILRRRCQISIEDESFPEASDQFMLSPSLLWFDLHF
jgi:hypothetical protein